MAKACKICRAVTLELDATGRCLSCALAKAAANAGTTYGKFVAKGLRYEPDIDFDFTEPPEPAPKPQKPAEPRYRECDFCGRLFNAALSNKRFCSKDCRMSQHKIEARERARVRAGNVGKRFCLICGKEIPPEANWNRKTCPGECSYQWRLKSRRENSAKYRERKKEQNDR